MPNTTVNYGFNIPLSDGSEYMAPDLWRVPITSIDSRIKLVADAKAPVVLIPPQSIKDIATGGTTAGTAELTLLTLPVAVTGDAATEVTLSYTFYNAALSVITDTFFLYFYRGATLIQRILVVGTQTVNIGGHTYSTNDIPPVGAHTYSVRLARNSGTGTLQLSVGASSPQWLTVKQFT